MSERKFETVSLLVDNYQQSDKILNAIIEDEQLSDTWDRYHLIGDVIRGEVSSTLPIDFSVEIASKIADEPIVFAPKSTVTKTRNIRAKIIQWSKPFGQLAIAASAAGVMILGIQHNVEQSDNSASVVPYPVIQTIPLAGISEPVSLNFQQQPDRNAQRRAYVEQQRRFQALLLDHQRQIKLKSIDDKTVENKVTPSSK